MRAAKQDERQRSLDAFLACMGREKKLLSDSIRESSGAYDEIWARNLGTNVTLPSGDGMSVL